MAQDEAEKTHGDHVLPGPCRPQKGVWIFFFFLKEQGGSFGWFQADN